MEGETLPPNPADLTQELADQIFRHLVKSPRDIASASLLCKTWNSCISGSDLIWRETLARRWPHIGRHVPDPLPPEYRACVPASLPDTYIAQERWRDACIELERTEAEVRRRLVALAASTRSWEWEHRLDTFQDDSLDFYAIYPHLQRFRRLEGGEACGLAFAAEVVLERVVAQTVARLMITDAEERGDGTGPVSWGVVDCRMELVALFIALMVRADLVRRGAADAPSPLAWVPLAVDELAEECRRRLENDYDDETALSIVNEVLFGPEGPKEGDPLHPALPDLRCPLPGFGLGLHRCDEEESCNPANSCLDQVLLRRRGLLVTLCLLHAMVARRLGLNIILLNKPHKVYNLVLCKNGDEECGGMVIDCCYGARIIALRGQGPNLSASDAIAMARRYRMCAAALGAQMLSNLMGENDAPRQLEVKYRVALAFSDLYTRPLIFKLSGCQSWYTSFLEEKNYFPYDLILRENHVKVPYPRIGQVVEWQGRGGACLLGVVLEFVPGDFIELWLTCTLTMATKYQALISFIRNLGPQAAEQINALHDVWSWRVMAIAAKPNYCIMLTPKGPNSGFQDLPLQFPGSVAIVDRTKLRAAVLPAADTLDDPDEAEKVRALERECGRYFTRRSSDGRGFLPNAATAERFGAACYSE